jgi:hypothetical protein
MTGEREFQGRLSSVDEAPKRQTWRERKPLRKAIWNWLERHQHPFNRGIHCVGIPLAVAGVVMFFTSPWYWALAALIVGYVLQLIGHLVEGNDMGEWAGVKRLLGLPYVAIAPQYEKKE